MSEFDPKPCECGERVDNQSTPIAGMVITLVGIEMLLDGTVDADWMGDALVLSRTRALLHRRHSRRVSAALRGRAGRLRQSARCWRCS